MESGQVIVLMALVMVFLIGALGLALDGGGMYFLWRDAQNATDAAVMAASYARCTGGNLVSAGLTAAKTNGFDNNGVTNKVTVVSPPTTGKGAGNPNYIDVTIWAKKPAYFIQLVYRGPLDITNHAVGYCSPPFDGGMVPGLWAGSPVCQNTVSWNGSSGYIEGGMFSNNEIDLTGSNIVVKGPVESVNGVDMSNSDNVTFDPGYPKASSPRPDPLNLDLSLYAPGGAIYRNVSQATYINGDFKVGNSDTIEGLYYVDGDVSVAPNAKIGPHGVTIVATGSIDFSGNTVKYYDEVMKPLQNGIQYPGLLFASSQAPSKACGDNAISVSGDNMDLTGITYAPKSGAQLKGSKMTYHGSVIADMIDFSGSDAKLFYESSLLPPRPPSVQVAE